MTLVDECKIRDAAPEDVDAIIELYKEALVPIWDRIHRPYDLVRLRRTLEKRFEKGHSGLVVVRENKIIGCVLTALRTGKISNKKVMKISSLLVKPEFFGKGLGQELIRIVEDTARQNGVERIRLKCAYKNTALEFYNKMGFQEDQISFIKELKTKKAPVV
ncbi:MAG: GNAT family N-acetyltransferase [archaeon]